MVKVRWLKDYKDIKKGEITQASNKSAENFVSQGYAEYVFADKKSEKFAQSTKKGPSVTKIGPSVTSSVTKNTKNTNKIPKKKSLSHVTNVTNVTNVTLEEKDLKREVVKSVKSDVSVTDVTDVTDILCLEEYFLGEKLSHLLFLLSQKEKLTYEQMSEMTDITLPALRQTITRNKDYFLQAGKEEKKTLWSLSDLGRSYFDQELEIAKKKKAKVSKDGNKVNKEIEDHQELENKINQMIDELNYEKKENYFVFDYMDIAQFEPELIELLEKNPEKFIKEVDDVLKLYKKKFTIKNLPPTSILSIEDIRAKHLGKLVSLTTRIASFGSVVPLVTKTKYECPSCGTIISIDQNDNKKIKEPSRCSCGRRGGFSEIGREMTDICKIILEDIQEKTDNPHSKRIIAFIKGDLTKEENIKMFMEAGNEIKCVGIVKEQKKINTGGEDTTLGVNFEILNATPLEDELDLEDFKDEELEEIKMICNDVDTKGLDVITDSFCPEVFGYESLKKAITLQIVARRNEVTNPVRTKPNILLIGDPGIAKSVLCKFATEVTQNSKRAVGGGSSAVGITASVVKEEDSLGGYRVEPGALVLAKDLLFLDELNNLSDEDKPKLQDGMNEMFVTINKASIHAKLPVVAGVLATANPIEGKFDYEKNIFEQFNIPAPIINRIDLIFVLKDMVSEERDKAIARNMILRDMDKITAEIEKQKLKKLFYYLRHQPEPQISEEMMNRLVELYNRFRGNKNRNLIINPRFLESFIRLVKASAKTRLSEQVEEKDILRCIDIVNESHYGEGGAVLTSE